MTTIHIHSMSLVFIQVYIYILSLSPSLSFSLSLSVSVLLWVYCDGSRIQCDWTRIKYNPVSTIEWPNDLSTRSIQGTEPRERTLCQVIQFPIPLDGKQRKEALLYVHRITSIALYGSTGALKSIGWNIRSTIHKAFPVYLINCVEMAW